MVAEAHQNVLKLRRSVNDRKVVLDRDLRVEIALLSAVDKNLLRCIFFHRALDARYVYQATFSLNDPTTSTYSPSSFLILYKWPASKYFAPEFHYRRSVYFLFVY